MAFVVFEPHPPSVALAREVRPIIRRIIEQVEEEMGYPHFPWDSKILTMKGRTRVVFLTEAGNEPEANEMAIRVGIVAAEVFKEHERRRQLAGNNGNSPP